MHTFDDSSTDHLSDTELLARERDDRDDLERRAATEPQRRDTTYGVMRENPALVESWERWWKTNNAARMRGILSRVIGR